MTGTASDPDGDSFRVDWSIISEPTESSLADPGVAVNPWTFTPTDAGTYILSFAVSNEGGTASDSVVITVLPQGSTVEQYGVQSITAERVTKGRWTTVSFTVVIGTASEPLEGAVVTADITRNGATFSNLVGTTNANGAVVFSIRRALTNLYTIHMNDVSHSTSPLSWDGVVVNSREDATYAAP